jgi:hypothetical protein
MQNIETEERAQGGGGLVIPGLPVLGVGFGTYIVLSMLMTFIFWYIRKHTGTEAYVKYYDMILGLVHMVLFVMVVNTLFLKNSPDADKIFRLGAGNGKDIAHYRKTHPAHVTK